MSFKKYSIIHLNVLNYFLFVEQSESSKMADAKEGIWSWEVGRP